MTHRNEFPTGYSLAGCSPALPASASPAALILNSFASSFQRTVTVPYLHCLNSPRSPVSIHRAVQDVPTVPRLLFPVCSWTKSLAINVFPVFPAKLAHTRMRNGQKQRITRLLPDWELWER
jgi:hypothetical protein